ncbi:MAG TPA: hypothetical protein VNO30_21045 [Kofleriaceae bacterium]|nr:hypothetical protein [Kofleriaceae bacterium]
MSAQSSPPDRSRGAAWSAARATAPSGHFIAPSARRLAAAGLFAAALAGAGCGKKAPEANPAVFTALASTMVKNAPLPGGPPECTGEQVLGGATMTVKTLLQVANQSIDNRPEREDFVNPPELDSPAVRVFVDPKASETARRRAAAELATAPFFLVYLIDHVDVPMALGVKELKRGFAAGRAIKYDKQGNVQCVRVFIWQNDKQVSDESIAKSNKAVIAPDVAQRLRDDLRAQLLKRIAALGAPPPVGTEMATKPKD